MNTKVSAFLSRHNFVRHEDVNTIIESILDDMNKGLRQEKSDEDMIPTWGLPPEKPVANKSVIVIDAGGTNFRSSLVSFDENGNATISEMEKTKMPGVEKELNKKDFFEQFAKNLEHLKGKSDRIGFCFSYPMQITQDGDGILLGFSKEVKAPEVVGNKIGECLKAALKEHGWPEIKRISMLNDTVAALLAGKACSTGQNFSSYVGFILGTGMNAAYIQDALPYRENFPRQIVVCESGKTRAVVRSDFDIEYDKTSAKPGEFYMEKCCSGAYLGPLSYFMLKAAASEGLFSEKYTKVISELTEFSTIDLNQFLHGPYNLENPENRLGKLSAGIATDDDMDTVFQLLDAVVERSARHAAAILAACVIQTGCGTNSAKPVCLLCDGTTFYRTYNIHDRTIGYLHEVLTNQRGLYFKVMSVENDITVGTAIAGLL